MWKNGCFSSKPELICLFQYLKCQFVVITRDTIEKINSWRGLRQVGFSHVQNTVP